MDERKERYLSKIKILNETVWENRVSNNKIESWLSNFKKEEQNDFLYLITQFIFFSKFQIENMLISIYRDFYKYNIIEEFRIKNGNTLDKDIIKTYFDSVKNKTRFIPIGNPSESSASLLGDFRKKAGLKKDLFIERSEIAGFVNQDIQHFIFIDDICGSGSQAVQYNKNILLEMKTLFSNAKIHYYTLLGTEKGLDYIRSTNMYDFVDSVLILDDTYKCFDTNSRIFKNNVDGIDVAKLEKSSREYGYKLIESIMKRGG